MRRALGWIYLLAWTAAHRAFRSRRRAHPAGEVDVRAAPGELGRRLRVLVVSPYSLHPMIHGGAVRIRNLVRHLSAVCDVHVLVLLGGTDDPEQRRALQGECRRVYFQLLPDAVPGDPWGLKPSEMTRFAAPAVRERVQALVQAHEIDVVQLEYTELAGLADGLAGVRVVLTEIDVTFRTHERRRHVGLSRRYGGASAGEIRRWRYAEIAACRQVDQVHVMSEEDRDFLAARLKDGTRRLRVVPNGVDTSFFRDDPEAERSGVLFAGSFPHLPNLDALEFFLSEVWPELRGRGGEVRLTVAGARPPAGVLALDGRDGITVAGEVESLLPLYQRHRVLAVPIRAGSGTRLKIVEALACGLPVVSTTLGAEGLPVADGSHLLLADTAPAMVEAILRLLQDDALARRLAREGRRLMEERFDWAPIARRLHAAHLDLFPGPGERLAPSPPASHPREETPAISIIILTHRPHDVLFDSLSAISAQELEHRFEVICVDAGSRAEDLERLRERNVRIVEDEGPPNQGRRLNLGARYARGRVLVFLDQDALPGGARWLAELTAPLFREDPPAAVQGAVADCADSPGTFPHKASFTRESQRWSQAHDGVTFSVANAAVRRDVWEDFPFCERPVLEDRRWQRRITESLHLVLPIYDAYVTRRHQHERIGTLFARTVLEGAVWRELGERYTLVDLLLDLLNPRLYPDKSGWRFLWRWRPTPGAELLVPWIRPVALFLGCWLKAPPAPPHRLRGAQE